MLAVRIHWQLLFGAVFVAFAGASDQIRLVGGSSSNEGRVEIFHDGVWGTVCDDGWTYEDARVVCRQLSYSDALQASGSASFGMGVGQIWMDGVRCLGTENRLQDCRFNGWRNHDCLHTEDAGVVCNVATLPPPNGTVRLLDGSTFREGRVEVWYNGMYGTVCDDLWDITDAAVVCRQLGYSGAEAAVATARFGQGDGLSIWLDDVRCSGSESRIEECAHGGWGMHNCDHSEDAGAICLAPGVSLDDLHLRLVNGATPNEGRLEVFWKGTWGTVCDDYWDLTAASVACQQLGYPGALLAVTNGRFGSGTDQIWMDNIHCRGTETRLQDCSFGGFGVHNCVHSEDAGVVCAQNMSTTQPGNVTVPVRLVGSSRNYEGRVEVYFGGSWGTVCDDFWDLSDAKVVCRQLGFSDAWSFVRRAYFGQGMRLILMDNVNCMGTEAQLADCTFSGWGVHDCSHSEDAGVVCATDAFFGTVTPNVSRTIRLVGGSHPWNGRLEILHRGVWGTVCDDLWSTQDSLVVCRQLGYSTTSVSYQKSAYYGRGSGTIWLDDVSCRGTEQRLEDCIFRGWDSHNCGHHEDVGVSCGGSASPTLATFTVNPSCSPLKVYKPCGPACPRSCSNPDPQKSLICLMWCVPGCFCPSSHVEYQDTCVLLESCPEGGGATDISPVDSQTLRLVGGDTIYEGRVEIFYNGKWGTVCDDSWSRQDALVVCRQLGFGDALQAYGEAYFGQGLGKPIWLDEVTCLGRENRLEQCFSSGFGYHDCGHVEDAGVRCEPGASPKTPSSGRESIRLVGGSSQMEGRVEIYHNGEYGTVCDDDWDLLDATVVCHQLGYEAAQEAVTAAAFGSGTGTIWLDTVQCTGSETRLEDCTKSAWGVHDCEHGEDAGVRCTASTVRLVGGSAAYEGRVEVLHGGQWGTVCDDFWDGIDSLVVCRQLGYSSPVTILTGTPYGQGSGTIAMDDVHCAGTEDRLEDCHFSGWSVHDCFHSEDVSIQCSNPAGHTSQSVRLVGSSSNHEGLVQVLHDGEWRGICDDSWDIEDARVVCHQLHFDDAQEATTSQTGYTYWMDEIKCTGLEDAIEECPFLGWGRVHCGTKEGAGVVCKNSSKNSSFPVIAVTVSLTVIIIAICVTIWWKQRSKSASQAACVSPVVWCNQEQSSTGTNAHHSPEKPWLWTAPRLLVEMPEPPSYGEAVVMPVPLPPGCILPEIDESDPVSVEPDTAPIRHESNV